MLDFIKLVLNNNDGKIMKWLIDFYTKLILVKYGHPFTLKTKIIWADESEKNSSI
jgi:superfamily I DNA and/or RNA helicase